MANKKKPTIVKREILKSNNLIESSYKLTTSENRLIDLALSSLEVIMLDKNLSAEEVKKLINRAEFDLIEINVSDYKKEYGIKNNTVYSELADSAQRLYDRNIIYFEGDDLVEKRWVITCKFKDDNNAIAMQFHPDLIADLLVFKSSYTRFDFDVKKYIRSYYTCRIYELLKQYESFGSRRFEIDELRFMLGIEDNEYPAYGNFKQRVIVPAMEQINKVTDLYCEFEEIKSKNKVTSVRFKYVKQSINFQRQEQISLFDSEVAITSEHNDYNVVKEFRELLGITIGVRQIDKVVEIASRSIKKYNINLPIKEFIKQKKAVVDAYALKHEVKSYLGALIRAIENNWTITSKEQPSDSFNNYQQRKYDGSDGEMTLDDIERKWLGYEDNEGFEDTPFEDAEYKEA